MKLSLDLPVALEQALADAARLAGMRVDDYALALLQQALPPGIERQPDEARHQELLDMFTAWNNEPADDEDAGPEFLEALDANRDGYRKLFPPETKGTSW